VRSGDTPASRRASLIKRPPHILVTTPESLYLMLTAERSRETLRGARTVIVDEIHATARDKRGSHLALSLERLEALCERRPVRIGLSATQRPIERIARLLVGASAEASLPDGRPRCEIVDAGHRRALDLGIWVPGSELGRRSARWSSGARSSPRSRRTWRITAPRSCSRTRAARPSGLRICSARRSGPIASRRTTAASPSIARQRVERRLRDGELAATRRDGLARARHRRRSRRARVSARLAARLSTFVQRVGPLGPRARRGAEGPPVPDARATSSSSAPRSCAACARASSTRCAARRAARHPRPADRRRVRRRAVEGVGALRSDAARSALRELARSDFDAVLELVADGIETGRGRRARATCTATA
jgi:ATP-dependent Lhr-like helicase